MQSLGVLDENCEQSASSKERQPARSSDEAIRGRPHSWRASTGPRGVADATWTVSKQLLSEIGPDGMMEWYGMIWQRSPIFCHLALRAFCLLISLHESVLFAIRFGAKDSFKLDLSQFRFWTRRRCVWLVQAEAAAAEWGGWTSAATGCLENPYEGLKNFFLTEVVIGEHFFWADWVSSWSMQLRNLTRSTAIGKIKGKKWNSCFVWNTAWLREDSWFMSIVTWCLWFQFSSCFFLSLLVSFCFCCHSGLRQNERRANELSIMKQQSQEKVSKLEDLEKESERRTLEIASLEGLGEAEDILLSTFLGSCHGVSQCFTYIVAFFCYYGNGNCKHL